MQYDSVLAELQKATAFELYRLQAAINILMEDPNRLSMVKQKLKPGMEVEYFGEHEKPGGTLDTHGDRQDSVEYRSNIHKPTCSISTRLKLLCAALVP
jgi:hypothetical protein